MNRLEIATAGLAIMAGSALGIYFYRGPAPTVAPETPTIEKPTSFSLLQEPRALPDISFSDGDGRSVKLSSFRGKVVLLNIWATWCPPCRAEMPTLDRLQAKLGGSGFEVVALSIDKGGSFVVRTFYDEIGIKALQIYIDQSGEASFALGVNGIPATLLIDRTGRELGRKIGPAEWDSPEVIKLIQSYLNAPAPVQLRNR